MSAFVFRVSAVVVALMLPTLAYASDTPGEAAKPVPLPRTKPSAEAAPSVPPQPPQPRMKPAPVPTPVPRPQMAPPVPSQSPAPQPIAMPTEAEIKAGILPCGTACGDILFKAVDECLWVQNQNPRPITFQARVDGRLIELRLEGASYEKSASGPAKPGAGINAYHTRQKDPFQSSSAGIPVYRVRLADKAGCVTARGQITQFVAVYSE